MNVSLSGTWKGRPDPRAKGVREKWFQEDACAPQAPKWEAVGVPSCWNRDPRYERYEGVFWYATEFTIPEDVAAWQTRAALRFDAVNYLCRVWVNGQEIGAHEGGYLPFEFALNLQSMKPCNTLVVMAENKRSDSRIPGRLCDWYNYGGIVRDVRLVVESPRRFQDVRITATPDQSGRASLHVAWKQQEPFAFSWSVKDGDRILAQASVEPGHSGQGEFSADLSGVQYWTPDTPRLYELRLDPEPLAHAEPFAARFGFRSIAVAGTRILLNGQPVKLQGVSLHEEQAPHGRALTPEMRRDDVQAIKDLGFNALRTAHYTHDESLLHAADEIGLLVLEEIPVYWEIDYASERVYKLAESMVRDMIARDFNHPSVIQWSVGNEVPVERKACDRFIRRLMDTARALDPTRIVTYVSCRFLIDDNTRQAADTACINCYMGWYMGRIRDLDEVIQITRRTAPDKPWIMTEFGAGALAGNTTRFFARTAESGPESPQSIVRRGVEKLSAAGLVDLGPARFTEEFQEKLLAHYIRTLNALDWVGGWFIWIYRDFRSPIRTNPYQNGFNRKGIVSETNEKKTFCFRLPELLEEYQDPEPVKNPGAKFRFFKSVERAAYTVFQPNLVRVQRKMYDDYYSDVIDE